MRTADKILIVDDDSEMALLMRDILTSNHYEVLVASNGLDAVDKSNKERVDLILLDIRLPLLSGFFFCEAFRKKPETRDIPVVVVSSLAGEENVQKAYRMGAVDYLKKPFESKDLLKVVRKALA